MAKFRVSIQVPADDTDNPGATSITKDHRGNLWREASGTVDLELSDEKLEALRVALPDFVNQFKD